MSHKYLIRKTSGLVNAMQHTQPGVMLNIKESRNEQTNAYK